MQQENGATNSSTTENVDVERVEITLKILETDDDDEPLERVKEKPPPGINASLVMLYAVFFVMFAVGWISLNSCSVNRLIPIYLIVAGFLGGLAKFLSTCKNKHLSNLAIALVILDVLWHGLGTYVVYTEYQPNYMPELGKYCNRTAYLLAFWLLTFQYTLLGIFILISGCYMLMKGDFKKK